MRYMNAHKSIDVFMSVHKNAFRECAKQHVSGAHEMSFMNAHFSRLQSNSVISDNGLVLRTKARSQVVHSDFVFKVKLPYFWDACILCISLCDHKNKRS